SLTVTAAKDITRGGGVYMALKDKGTGEFRVFLICEVDVEGKLTLGKYMKQVRMRKKAFW
ncbi:MAG: hypothetical protein K6F44_06995, partial [Lachnospiraceae bacterium]|nr:hypothetical protein [Lachnospiraceae bacterium]